MPSGGALTQGYYSTWTGACQRIHLGRPPMRHLWCTFAHFGSNLEPARARGSTRRMGLTHVAVDVGDPAKPSRRARVKMLVDSGAYTIVGEELGVILCARGPAEPCR